MKCSKCGKRFNSLPAMAKHYRKKHPAAMKAHKVAVSKRPRNCGIGRAELPANYKFCPHCGGFLG